MSKEDKKSKKSKKNCGTKQGVMLAFGLTTLGSRVVTAVSLAAIALSLCSIKKESTSFNDCVLEARESGKSNSTTVNYNNVGQ